MTFDGSAIKALLDDAVSKGAVHGIAAVVVDRSGPLFHHAAGEAGQHAMFRNASMTKLLNQLFILLRNIFLSFNIGMIFFFSSTGSI